MKIEKYGKWVDMTKINRDLNQIKQMMENDRKYALSMELREDTARNACVVCGSKRIHPFLSVHGIYDYCECEECGALTLLKYPDVKEMYATESESANGNVYIDDEVFEKRKMMIAKPKADFVFEVLDKLGVESEKWLDIGCGGGEFISYINEVKHVLAEGLETDKSEIIFARSKNLIVHDKFIDPGIEDIELSEILGNRDVISFFNVLEHVEKPKEYIEYLYNNMKTGASIVLEVPKHPSLASFANMTSLNHIYRHIVPPIHLQVFSKKSLEILMKDKFEIKGTWEFGQGFMDVINNSMIISQTKENEMYYRIAEASNDIQKKIDEVGLADQILIVARRM